MTLEASEYVTPVTSYVCSNSTIQESKYLRKLRLKVKSCLNPYIFRKRAILASWSLLTRVEEVFYKGEFILYLK